MKGPFGATMAIAASAMRAQGTRLRLVSENLANADVPGYRRKQVSFETLMDGRGGEPAGGVKVDRVFPDRSAGKRVYDPSHPNADGQGYVTLSNVNSIVEIADMKQANRSYQASLLTFEQARTMYQRTLDLIRN